MTTPRRRPQASEPSPFAKWLPAIAAVSVLVVVVLAGVSGGKHDNGVGTNAVAGSADTTASESATSTSAIDGSSVGYDVTGLTVPDSTLPAIGTDGAAVPVVKTQLGRTLVGGAFGDDVKQLQTRLTQLGFAPGAADGAFGEQTKEAVWAFDKLVLQVPRDQVDHGGRVSNETWQKMQDPIVIQPRRPGSGTHVEIYLPEQVAAVFTDDKATLVIHISSGTALTSERTADNSWCETVRLDTDPDGNVLNPPQEKAVCGVSYTPGGVFRFQRQVTGDRVGALGRMFNPIYFNFGIAMHGAKNVPLVPASHGCIRMNQKISDTFQSYVHLKDRVYVWGQDGQQPEQYSKRQSTPVFNYPDPNATTTTVEATTTTVKATATTLKPTNTTVKAAVTTTTEAAAKSSATTTTTAAAKPTVPATAPGGAPTTPPTTAVLTTPPTTSPPDQSATTLRP